MNTVVKSIGVAVVASTLAVTSFAPAATAQRYGGPAFLAGGAAVQPVGYYGHRYGYRGYYPGYGYRGYGYRGYGYRGYHYGYRGYGYRYGYPRYGYRGYGYARPYYPGFFPGYYGYPYGYGYGYPLAAGVIGATIGLITLGALAHAW